MKDPGTQGERRAVNRTTEKALNYIRQAILTGKFPAGASLPTKTLAEEIGVSRTPIRDALRQLETEGLVTIAPRQEACVKELTFDDYKAMCELRTALETHAAMLAALRRTKADLDQLRHYLGIMEEWVNRPAPASEQEDEAMIQAIAEADIQFHLAIMDASRNRLLKREATRFRVIQGLVRLPPNEKIRLFGSEPKPWIEHRNPPANVLKSHQEIFKAIEQNSPEQAYCAMRDHLETSLNTQLYILKMIKSREQWGSLSV